MNTRTAQTKGNIRQMTVPREPAPHQSCGIPGSPICRFPSGSRFPGLSESSAGRPGEYSEWIAPELSVGRPEECYELTVTTYPGVLLRLPDLQSLPVLPFRHAAHLP